MYWAPMADNQPNNAYPWEYYLLSGKQQLSVWAGQQMSLASCDSTGRRVYMYPTEYLSYGVGASALLTTRPNGVKQYKIVDHLGSTRAVVSGGGSVGWQQDYDPYGSVLAGAAETRKGYIDKERDRESGTHNHGVRQYDPGEGGRFLSVDRYWEKYRNQSPYAYSNNNPLNYSDPSGDTIIIIPYNKSDQKYVNLIGADINKLLSTMGIAQGVITTLMQSKNIHKIYVSDAIDRSTTSQDRYASRFAPYNGVGCGSEIKLSMSEVKELNEPLFIVLFHEFVHAYHIDKGNSQKGKIDPFTGIDVEELNTVKQFENEVRTQFNLPRRDNYGGVPVDVPKPGNYPQIKYEPILP